MGLTGNTKRAPSKFRHLRTLFQSGDSESGSTLKGALEGQRKNRAPGQGAATASKEDSERGSGRGRGGGSPTAEQSY